MHYLTLAMLPYAPCCQCGVALCNGAGICVPCQVAADAAMSDDEDAMLGCPS